MLGVCAAEVKIWKARDNSWDELPAEVNKHDDELSSLRTWPISALGALIGRMAAARASGRFISDTVDALDFRPFMPVYASGGHSISRFTQRC